MNDATTKLSTQEIVQLNKEFHIIFMVCSVYR